MVVAIHEFLKETTHLKPWQFFIPLADWLKQLIDIERS
jgi:hypothetical protein